MWNTTSFFGTITETFISDQISRYQFWDFFDSQIFETDTETFFETQIFETDTETFFETKYFKTDTETFFETKIFETDTETFIRDQLRRDGYWYSQKNEKSLDTEKSLDENSHTDMGVLIWGHIEGLSHS